MATPKETKTKITKKYGNHPKDSGGTAVQIALLTETISQASEHLRLHKHDNQARRIIMINSAHRRRLLAYLHRTDIESYNKVITSLKIRNAA